MEGRTLTPTQERLLAQLRRGAPLEFDEAFVRDLVERAQDSFESISSRLGGVKVYVSKHFLTSVHGCEVQHLLPDDFEWTPARAKGFVAHKAIELQLNWRGEPVPAELVDEAIARLSEQGNARGDYLAGLIDADHAELRSQAIERVTRFAQDFPPLPVSAHPVTEAWTRHSPTACIELSGKADLVLGRPDGRVSTKLIVDLKSGQRSHAHALDLRFYALLETLVRGVPPRRLVTYYLDYATAAVEEVSESLLEATLDRVVDALEREVELRIDARAPVKRPGVSCRWCPLHGTCVEGRAHLAAIDDDGRQGFDDELAALSAT